MGAWGSLDAQHLSPADPRFCPPAPLAAGDTPGPEPRRRRCQEHSLSLAVPREAAREEQEGAVGLLGKSWELDHLSQG